MASAKEIATRYYEALNTKDAQKVVAFLSPSSRVEVPGAVLEGPGQAAGWLQAFFNAFPDLAHTPGEISEIGHDASASLVVEGTHTAPLVSHEGTIPPTNRRIRLEAKNELQVEGDVISHLKIVFDQADFMRQLGLT